MKKADVIRSYKKSRAVILCSAYMVYDGLFGLLVKEGWKGLPKEMSWKCSIWVEIEKLSSKKLQKLNEMTENDDLVVFLPVEVPQTRRGGGTSHFPVSGELIIHSPKRFLKNVATANVELIRLLDSISGKPPRQRSGFPHRLQRDAVLPSEGVLIPVLCVRKRKKFFYRVIEEHDTFCCMKDSLVKNRFGLPEVATISELKLHHRGFEYLRQLSEVNNYHSFKEILDGSETKSDYIPACPFCGWTFFHQCENCGAIHCLPRDGYIFMGNGCCLQKPDHTEKILLRCPKCRSEKLHSHYYYHRDKGSRNHYMDGDPPLK